MTESLLKCGENIDGLSPGVTLAPNGIFYIGGRLLAEAVGCSDIGTPMLEHRVVDARTSGVDARTSGVDARTSGRRCSSIGRSMTESL
jgi:hypothetical protein